MAATPGADAVANEKTVWELFKSKNFDAFAAMLAPDFLEVDPGGFYDKAGSVKSVSMFDASKAVLSDWQTVKVNDKAALVTYTVKGSGFAPEGERHSTIWANRDGKWAAMFHHGGTPVRKPTAPPPPSPSPAASPAPKAAASPAAKASPATP